MIAGLKPYPDYRDSGVPWLGRIPSHWGVVRSKRMFSARNELARPTDVQLSATQAYGVIPQAEFEAKVGRRVVKISMHLEKRRHVEKDDFVISMRSFQGGLERAWATGCIRSSYVVLKPVADIDAVFFTHLFKSPDYIRALQSTADFIRDGQDLNYGDFCAVDLPLVPLDEQRRIARVLHHADRRIRTYIRARKKLMSLMNEQRRAILYRAVTRGLDPDVRLKPAGVEWLGEVPEHWTVSRVKDEFVSLNRRRVPLSGTERGMMTTRRYDYYGASGVIDKVDDYLFDDELLLIAEDGANLMLRNLPLAIVARGRFWVNNHAHVLKPKRGHLQFLADLMEHIDYLPWISGAAQPKLTSDRLMGIAIAVPAPAEQLRIVEQVSAETRSLRATIDRAAREIELLNDYRVRLVADVVTGRIDVRGTAESLPDECVLDEVFDDGCESSATADAAGDLDGSLQDVDM